MGFGIGEQKNLQKTLLNEKSVEADICVIGAGMAGICVAVAAARRGLRVAVINDRPVAGGNASSEIRMWIRGAGAMFPDYREGGIIEEIGMDNTYYNPSMLYCQWDGVLYNKLIAEEKISLFLNATCVGAETKDGHITEITAWQLTTYTRISIKADLYADCSGDSILAEFTDAQCRRGTESREEFGESLAPEQANSHTMGNSCLIQARETEHESAFVAPPFAYKFSDEDFAYRMDISKPIDFEKENFWWLEVGGDGDTLRDAENYNKELIARAFGLWDYIKNSGRFSCEKWELDWVGFLAGKRESRRYIGDYILSQNDIDSARKFDDEIAYGGWSMDDHNPMGLRTRDMPNIHYRVNKPYAIPYRCLYSVNIDNLFFAGRNVSVTHLALSSTRVMATCALMGQAVGVASAIAKKYGVKPRGVLAHIDELKQALRDDDCYLLNTPRSVSRAVKSAKTNLSESDFEKLTSGIERNLDGRDNAVSFGKEEKCILEFDAIFCSEIRIVFDNDIARTCYGDEITFARMYPNKCHTTKSSKPVYISEKLVKSYSIRIKINGKWMNFYKNKNNHQRLVKVPVQREIEGIEFSCDETYGLNTVRLFSVDILG